MFTQIPRKSTGSTEGSVIEARGDSYNVALYTITVPRGFYGGMHATWRDPLTGSTIKFQIPQGLGPGATFPLTVGPAPVRCQCQRTALDIMMRNASRRDGGGATGLKPLANHA